MREYTTNYLPNYVRQYYGKPLKMIGLSRNRYRLSGPNAVDEVTAVCAVTARKEFAKLIQSRIDVDDGRVTRHRIDPLINEYEGHPDYAYSEHRALAYPLMYRKGGTKYVGADGETYVRLIDQHDLHIFMCAVRTSDGEIVHVSRIPRKKT